MKKEKNTRVEELRADVREAAEKGGSIEFKPSENAMVYQFGLRDWSTSGLGILVRNDSRVLALIEVGQVISLKVHDPGGHVSDTPIEAEIRHISEPEDGRHPDHKIIGLQIL
ncbi:MAG: hypothetical protein HUN04_19660 [Desulfobacter sp.]|nr:MAG: hypothetical protein HUN04_19660 [Desulfobacter sp.]